MTKTLQNDNKKTLSYIKNKNTYLNKITKDNAGFQKQIQ